MKKEQKEQMAILIDQCQYKEVGQIINKITKAKLNRIDKIRSWLIRAKQKIILTVLVSLLLFVLFLQYKSFWIPFCIAGFSLFIPISEYRYLKKRLANQEQDLKESWNLFRRMAGV